MIGGRIQNRSECGMLRCLVPSSIVPKRIAFEPKPASNGKGAEVSRLLRLATEYDQLADSMGAIRSEKPRPP